MPFDQLRRQLAVTTRRRRISGREFQRGVNKGRHIKQEIIKNTDNYEDSVTLNDGETVTLTSTVTSTLSDDIRLAAIPYQIAIFETSYNTGNIIPGGGNITHSDYVTYGPFAMPKFSPGGTDGNNIVYKTAITNNSGGQVTLLFYTQVRYFTGYGGAAS